MSGASSDGAGPAAAGKTYFVANESPVTWEQLYDAVAAAAGSRPLQIEVPRPAVKFAAHAGDLLSAFTGRSTMINTNKAALAKPRWWLCDASRIREELEWKSTVPLQSGVRETYNWYVDAEWLRPPKVDVTARALEEPRA